jgi:hypothetical protein
LISENTEIWQKARKLPLSAHVSDIAHYANARLEPIAMLAASAAVTRAHRPDRYGFGFLSDVNVSNQSGRSLARLRSDDTELVVGLGRRQ